MKKSIILFANMVLVQLTYARTLSLKEYIKLSRQNDPRYAEIANEKRALKSIVNQGLPSRHVILSVGTENGFSSDSNQNTTVATGEISKEIIESGTNLSISHSKTTRPDRKEDVTEARLEQSLYKNMFGRDVRLKKESLLKQRELKALEIQESLETFLVDSLKSYLELNKLNKDYSLLTNIHREAKRLSKNVSSRMKSKVASKTDYKRSQLLELLRKEEMDSKKSLYETKKKQIAAAINLNFIDTRHSDSSELVNLLEHHAQKIESKVNWKSIRSNQMALANINIKAKESALQDRSAQPELNLIVGYNKDDSSRFSTIIKRTETVIGLKLQVPFGDTKSTANQELAKVQLQRAQLQLRLDAIDHRSQRVLLQAELLQCKNQLIIDSKKVSLIKEILRDDENRFSRGQISLESLIELKNNFATYRMNQEQSKLKYTFSLIDWLALNDALTEELILTGQ